MENYKVPEGFKKSLLKLKKRKIDGGVPRQGATGLEMPNRPTYETIVDTAAEEKLNPSGMADVSSEMEFKSGVAKPKLRRKKTPREQQEDKTKEAGQMLLEAERMKREKKLQKYLGE